MSNNSVDEVHISSYVVQTRPQQTEQIRTLINEIYGAEIHGTNPQGKMVLILESDSENDISDLIIKINSIPGVINTALVFHQIDNEIV